MPVTDQLDAFRRRSPAAGYPLAVAYKFVDDHGGYLAALVTYYSVVSLFPLLLLMSTVLGFVLVGNPQLREQILLSAPSQLLVVGSQLGTPREIGGGPVGLVVGLLGARYGGLGVTQAGQHAMNTSRGDRRACTSRATAQRSTGFERTDVQDDPSRDPAA